MKYYKEKIQNLLKSNTKDREDIIRIFLKNEYDKNRITQEQYDELLRFLEGKIEEIKNEEQCIKQEKFNKELNEFQKSIKLDVTPIYKGEWGTVAPGRQKLSKNDDDSENQKEEK